MGLMEAVLHRPPDIVETSARDFGWREIFHLTRKGVSVAIIEAKPNADTTYSWDLRQSGPECQLSDSVIDVGESVSVLIEGEVHRISCIQKRNAAEEDYLNSELRVI